MKKKNKRKLPEELRFEDLLQVVYYTVEEIRMVFLIKREKLFDFLVEKRKKENKSNMLFFVFTINRYGEQSEAFSNIKMP